MPPATPTAPTAAERIRSACARGPGAVLAVDGAEPVATPIHHLLDGGSFAVTMPIAAAAAALVVSPGDAPAQAVVELTDYAPLPLRERVRALVWITGRLHRVPRADAGDILDLIAAQNPNPALLQVDREGWAGTAERADRMLARLEVESVVVADSTGAESVGVSALLAARPDPFCALESCWLRHIWSDHPDVISRLAAKLPAPLRRGHVSPLGIDRYGLCLRVENDDGDHDVRLPFLKPVDDVTGLGRAIRVLMGCPFLNGLRARRT